MIAYFFKQSKPIVFIVLIAVLSLSFFLEIANQGLGTYHLNTLLSWGLKYFALIGIFLIFISVLKQFEVQKRHGLGYFYFTLFSCLSMPFLINGSTLYALLLVSLAIYNSYKLIHTSQTHLTLFQLTIYFYVASFFVPGVAYMLLMVLVATLLFTSPQWRMFIVPIYAIATVILWIQAFKLLTTNTVYGPAFFFPKWTFNFNILSSTTEIAYLIFWVLILLVFVYQFVKVREKRAIFHRNNARYFICFLLIAIASLVLTVPSVEILWVLSIWPFAIYIADFVWRIRKKLWTELAMLLSLIGVILVLTFL